VLCGAVLSQGSLAARLKGVLPQTRKERFLTSAGRPFVGAKGKRKIALLRSK
jgi:hypothetical protein